jgi:hypothetical protein
MNKTAVIIGGVAFLGIGAYFYFKPKATVTTGAGSTGAGTTGTGATGTSSTGTSSTGTGMTSVPPTGTVLYTPEQVLMTAKIIADAKSLATQISDKRTKRSSYLVISLKDYAVASDNKFWANNDQMLKMFKDQDIKKLEAEIKDLDEQLGKLGYMEVNGSIVKIN